VTNVPSPQADGATEVEVEGGSPAPQRESVPAHATTDGRAGEPTPGDDFPFLVNPDDAYEEWFI